MRDNASFNRIQTNEGLIDDLTVNKLTINNSIGSISDKDTTFINESKKSKMYP